MDTPVNTNRIDKYASAALAYLRSVMRDRAPEQLGECRIFETSPLDGEGPTALFEFTIPSASAEQQRHFVAVGQTEPNYYPALDLSFDDAFALHLGTRFMLVMQVGVATSAGELDVARAVQSLIDSVRPNEPVSDVELAASFDVDGQFHGVARCRIRNQSVYVFIGQAPAGFSTSIHHPAQVAYRIHLGRALIAEMERPKPRSPDDMEFES